MCVEINCGATGVANADWEATPQIFIHDWAEMIIIESSNPRRRTNGYNPAFVDSAHTCG